MKVRSDHFDGERFFNPGTAARTAKSVPKMLAEPRAAWPRSVPVAVRKPAPHDPSSWVTITFVGHATFIIQTAAVTFITDPMFSDRASPLSFIGPRRVRGPGVTLDLLPKIDVVLLSHNHYDHCDLPSLRAIRRRFDPLLVTPLRNGRLPRSAGYRRVEELDWWERSQSAPLPVTLTPARHFSARTPFDRNRELWGSFVIEIDRQRLFFCGDSAYDSHFGEVRRRLGEIALALLPIGAYEPRWFMREVHMNPAEAVRAHRDLGAVQSVGMHFGTFQLTAEAIDEPLRALDRARQEQGLATDEFVTLDFGASLSVIRQPVSARP